MFSSSKARGWAWKRRKDNRFQPFSLLSKKVPNPRNNGSRVPRFHSHRLSPENFSLARTFLDVQLTNTSVSTNDYCLIYLIIKRRYLLPFPFIYMWSHSMWYCSCIFWGRQFNTFVNFNRNACSRIRILMATSKVQICAYISHSYINNFLESNIFFIIHYKN